jgi:hypothetical protein
MDPGAARSYGPHPRQGGRTCVGGLWVFLVLPPFFFFLRLCWGRARLDAPYHIHRQRQGALMGHLLSPVSSVIGRLIGCAAWSLTWGVSQSSSSSGVARAEGLRDTSQCPQENKLRLRTHPQQPLHAVYPAPSDGGARVAGRFERPNIPGSRGGSRSTGRTGRRATARDTAWAFIHDDTTPVHTLS